MDQKTYRLSKDVAYELVAGEVVALQETTGEFYRFNAESHNFFNFLSEPRQLADYPGFESREIDVALISFLLQEQLAVETALAPNRHLDLELRYEKPGLVSEGEPNP